MSIASTFVPEMARAVGRRDRRRFTTTSSLGVRIIAMLTIPAAVVLFVLRRPLIGLLLQHGEYTALDALVTSRALAGFALGLPAFSVYLFALRGFYAHQDTRTPFVINGGQCVLNIAFAFAFFGPWGVLGLGAAFALSYALAGVWALSVLATKVRGYPFRGLLESIARMLLAGVLAAEATWWVARQVGGNSGADALIRLLAGTVTALVVYAVVLFVVAAPELRSLRRLGRRPVRPAASTS
jgi:putative peptidoglycan lipid II flippase